MNIKPTLLDAVGNTPLVQLNKVAPKQGARIYAKCEFMNPTGSIKDRMALYIIEQAEKNGTLKPGATIIENTSGNTGLSLAMVAAIKGYRCIFTLPDKMSLEKINMMKAFGAEVVVTPTDVPGDSPEHYVETAKRLAREIPNAFYVNQYHSPDNIAAHYTSTGPEIWEQTDGKLDYFVAGTGTGGTLSGAGRYLKEKKPSIQNVGIDPIGSVHYDLFYNQRLVEPKIYKVEGIGEDIRCQALDFSVIDQMQQTNDQQAFLMARRLVREEGLFCGGSSGAIVHGAAQLAKTLSPDQIIVTVLTDSGSRYISKFLNDSWMKDHGFLAQPGSLGKVSDLIQPGQTVITAHLNHQVSDLINLFKMHGISQIPIIDDAQKPVSIVHEMDILRRLQDQQIHHDSLVCELSKPLNGIVTPEDSIDKLYPIFDKEEVAVVVSSDRILAIVSQIDVIDYMMGALNERKR